MADAHILTATGRRLLTSRGAQAIELVSVFGVAYALIALMSPLAGQNPLLRQAVVWVANLAMLGVVWLGLRLRGQSWGHFGLHFNRASGRTMRGRFLRSLVVLVVAVASFVLGSIAMANLIGIPEPADMSGYQYLRGNLPLLLLALAGVYLVSSFGEEVIYRGFIINRLAEMGASGVWAVRAAVVCSAVVFGVAHYQWGPMGIVQTGCMGLALGMSYLRVGRDLWVLVLAHPYMDTALLVQQYLPVS